MNKKFFQNKTILITGGTGSFGKHFLNKLLKINVKKIKIFSRDEKKQDDLRKKVNHPKIEFYIGDVRDYKSLTEACTKVDYIFHAAALKQVPSCEFYPLEAIKTNIIGTENIIDNAIKKKVKKLVLLSTDKAVYPINSMGLSKAMAERVLISKSRNLNKNDTTLCVTRYGNVMGSRGSVIPLFNDQIEKGKNITLTNKRMSRFMMSLDESIDLVAYAMEHGKQGEIFVQKSPSALIEDVAKKLIEMKKSKSKIKIIGTRHGEKEYETLVSKEEMYRSFSIKNFYKISPDTRDLNYSKYFTKGHLNKNLEEYNSNNTNILKGKKLEKILKKYV